MKNLEQLGVQELNTQELREIEGGWRSPAYYYGFAVGTVAGLLMNTVDMAIEIL